MIKIFVLEYFHNLSSYDYLAFTFEFFLFLLFLIFIVILFQKSKSVFALLIIIIFLIFIALSPFLPQIFFATNLKKVEIIDMKESYLSFSKTLLYSFNLKQKSKFKLSKCLVSSIVIPQNMGVKKQFKKFRKDIQVINFSDEKIKIVFKKFLFKEYKLYNYINCF